MSPQGWDGQGSYHDTQALMGRTQTWGPFCHAFLTVLPKDQWLAATQAATLLLPDENREVLQTLLYFLSDIASAEENQMTAGNLAAYWLGEAAPGCERR